MPSFRCSVCGYSYFDNHNFTVCPRTLSHPRISRERRQQEIERFIPLDKSWLMRMGLLDITHDRSQIVSFLSDQPENSLGDDLDALLSTAKSWITREGKFFVGESGTLYRFVKFACWKLNRKFFIWTMGTLTKRQICNDSSIVNWPLAELLKLDNGTSQWASASVLMGNQEPMPEDAPYKLKLTYEALAHRQNRIKSGQQWEAKKDETILRQADYFMSVVRNGNANHFEPQQAEDYCIARAFGMMTPNEGLNRFPSLVGHESNRITEMDNELHKYCQGDPCSSKDHRVVQAIAMRAARDGKKTRFMYPGAVEKSWPQFWNFLEYLKPVAA